MSRTEIEDERRLETTSCAVLSLNWQNALGSEVKYRRENTTHEVIATRERSEVHAVLAIYDGRPRMIFWKLREKDPSFSTLSLRERHELSRTSHNWQVARATSNACNFAQLNRRPACLQLAPIHDKNKHGTQLTASVPQRGSINARRSCLRLFHMQIRLTRDCRARKTHICRRRRVTQGYARIPRLGNYVTIVARRVNKSYLPLIEAKNVRIARAHTHVSRRLLAPHCRVVASARHRHLGSIVASTTSAENTRETLAVKISSKNWALKKSTNHKWIKRYNIYLINYIIFT